MIRTLYRAFKAIAWIIIIFIIIVILTKLFPATGIFIEKIKYTISGIVRNIEQTINNFAK